MPRIPTVTPRTSLFRRSGPIRTVYKTRSRCRPAPKQALGFSVMESVKMLMQARNWLVLLLSFTVATGSYGATVGHTEQDNIQVITPSGRNGKGEVGDMEHVPEIDPIGPPAQSTHATVKVTCNEDQPADNHAMDDFLSALNPGWNRDSKLGSAEFQRFGICSQHDAISDSQVTALTHLAESVHQQRNDLKGVQATEVDIWDSEKEEEIILALKFPRYIHPSRLASLMLLFNVEPIKADGLSIKFNSHFLHPNTQAVCISEATRFFILTGGRRESHTHTHLKMRVKVETLKAENGQKLSLSELQEVLIRSVNGSNITMRPMLLFLADRDDSERASHLKHPGIPLDQGPSSPLPPSRTFLFLCELQKFLNNALPQKEPPGGESEEGESTISLDTLHSLPPLTLEGSSPQSLLSGLVNSSTPTVFVFPQHLQGLQTHRVELNLETPLLSVLRQRLAEAMAQVKEEEAGQKVIDRLQRLSEMSALPPEGKNSEAVTKEHKEAQYRSVLLLKALQTVLSVWEVERGQRAARAGEDGPALPDQCRLQSLIVSLRKYSLEPSMAKINNCEGSCTFPINISNNHVIFLNSHIQSGHPVNRSPCCVPVEYNDLFVIELESKGTVMSFKTNVVATKCECR